MLLAGIIARLEKVFALLDPYWEGITTVALVATLFYAIKYTRATWAMAKVHDEELGLNKSPVISVTCFEQKNFFFRTSIRNFSMVHAKVRVKATIIIDGQVLKIPEDNLYNGTHVWQVQAQGPLGNPFQGHLSLDSVLSYNDLPVPPLAQVQCKIIIESWVINFYENEKELLDDDKKNPIGQWTWNSRKQIWIPDLCPGEIE